VSPAVQIVKRRVTRRTGAIEYVLPGANVIYTYQTGEHREHIPDEHGGDGQCAGRGGTVAGPVAPGATNYLYATNLNMTLNVTNVGLWWRRRAQRWEPAAGHPAVTDNDDAIVDVVSPAVQIVKTAGNAADGRD